MKLNPHALPDDIEMAVMAGRRIVPGLNASTLVSALETYEPGRTSRTPTASSTSDFVTVAEYARRMKCCSLTVSRLLKAGRLDHVRLGRGIRIPANATPKAATRQEVAP